MKTYKNLRMDTKIGREEVEKDSNNREVERKKGPMAVSWFEALSDDDKKRVIESSQACERLIDTYGIEVKNMTVVARSRSLEDYARLLDSMRCRL